MGGFCSGAKRRKKQLGNPLAGFCRRFLVVSCRKEAVAPALVFLARLSVSFVWSFLFYFSNWCEGAKNLTSGKANFGGDWVSRTVDFACQFVSLLSFRFSFFDEVVIAFLDAI